VARGDTTTLPALAAPRLATSTLALPGFGPATPPPVPARVARRSGFRRVLALLAVSTVGLIAGGTAAVVERIVTATGDPESTTGPDPVDSAAVMSALRPLGQQSLATRAFETEVVDDSGFPGLGQEVVYYGVGSVEATVDFGGVGRADVRVLDSGARVRVRLPGVVLGEPVLDEDRSGVVLDGPNLFDILFPDSVGEADLRAAAIADLADIARQSDLPSEAAQAAVVEVRRRVGPLGARTVEVRFDQ